LHGCTGSEANEGNQKQRSVFANPHAAMSTFGPLTQALNKVRPIMAR
jgi:hypothetical protein